MAGKLTYESLKRRVDEEEVDTVIVAQTDMQGRLMGKRFQAEHFLEHASEETHSCNYLLALDMEMEPVPGYKSASWERGYGDYIMRPDLATLRMCPWAEGAAMCLADVLDHHGTPVPHSPRAVLQRQIARAEALGFHPMMATELEFYLFRQSFEEAHEQSYAGLTPSSPYNEDYHIFQTFKEEEVMRAIRTGLWGADIPVESTKGEADAGQAEINIRYSDALRMADRHVIAKNAIKEIAWAAEHAVTFMAKWHDRYAGSSCHIHQSLLAVSDEAPAFPGTGSHGMSDVMQSYLAGLLRHASEMTAFLAPMVNSYKRFVAGTFAPTKAVWSRDNRTAGFRIVGEGTPGLRIECRTGGADLNPYLAMAGMIAAGVAGIAGKYVLEQEFTGDAYGGEGREIPKTLRAAADALESSEMLRTALGADVVEHYTHAARWEVAQSDAAVTDWDRRRGFERS